MTESKDLTAFARINKLSKNQEIPVKKAQKGSKTSPKKQGNGGVDLRLKRKITLFRSLKYRPRKLILKERNSLGK